MKDNKFTYYNIPYNFLSKIGTDPIIIKLFLKFLLYHGIYESYVGRLGGKVFMIEPHIRSIESILTSSFTWSPTSFNGNEMNGGLMVINHFNSKMGERWVTYSKLWKKYIDKNINK